MAQEQSGSHDVLRRNAVTEVHYSSLRINSANDTLHDPDIGIRVAEIAGERDEHGVPQEMQ
jgi:hypothetical protein